MSQHTPGPWMVMPQPGSEPTSHQVQTVGGKGIADWIDAEADARLIASAPAMLAALKAFIDQATKLSGFPASYEPYAGALVLAKAAISLATPSTTERETGGPGA